MSIKLVELFANRVVERRKMINYYLRGRSSIESVGGVLILSFCFDFELFLLFWAFLSSSLLFFFDLLLFMPFVGFCGFPSSR
jgi:hypothetical protein